MGPWELPKARHQPGVWIRRQPTAGRQLPAEILQVLLVDAAFEKGPGVDPRRRVPLDVHLVRRLPTVLAVEEVVEADLIERSRRGERGNVPADAVTFPIGADHHRHGVPADQALDLPLQSAVARVFRLMLGRDRVDIGCRGATGQRHTAVESLLLEPFQEEGRPIGARRVDDILHASSHSEVSCGSPSWAMCRTTPSGNTPSGPCPTLDAVEVSPRLVRLFSAHHFRPLSLVKVRKAVQRGPPKKGRILAEDTAPTLHPRSEN